MKHRIVRTVDVVSVAMVVWLIGAMVPASWLWFDPGPVRIADSVDGKAPAVGFTRTIHRDTAIRYSVIVRELDTHRITCDGDGGPFTYRTGSTLPERIDLRWWAGGECWPLPSNTYITETCWTVVRPFLGLVPAKTVCRESNPFTVIARAE